MLSDQNPHELDALLTFEEGEHAYTYTPTGERVRISMSGVLKRCFPDEFNGKAVAHKYFAAWTRDETSKYWGLCQYLTLVQKLDRSAAEAEICKLWSLNGEKARDDGTDMHATLEDYINGVWQPVPPPDGGLIPGKPPHEIVCYLGMLDSFYPDMELRPWRTELKMVVTETFEHQVQDEVPYDVTIPVMCGTADLIMKDKLGRYWILDWKRVDPKKGKLGKRKASGGSGSQFPDPDAVGFMAGYPNNAFTKYSAQLLGYKWMFEKGGYLKEGEEVAGAFIVQIHPDLPDAHVIEAGAGLDDGFEEMVVAMMEDEIVRARGEKKAALDGPHAIYLHEDF